MLPPPAPISAMSMAGTRSRKPEPRLRRLPCDRLPPISNSPARWIWQSSTTDALAVVPPMSTLIAFGPADPARERGGRDDAGRRARIR